MSPGLMTGQMRKMKGAFLSILSGDIMETFETYVCLLYWNPQNQSATKMESIGSIYIGMYIYT
jgi:hypothetical protein